MAPQAGKDALPSPNYKKLGNTHSRTRKHTEIQSAWIEAWETSHIPRKP